MTVKRKQFTAQFKFKVALEAAGNQKTQGQIASQYGVHPTQIGQWKKELLKNGKSVFEKRSKGDAAEQAAQKETELYEQIGRLKMELEWLKKKVGHIG